jgi:hypothetical protein
MAMDSKTQDSRTRRLKELCVLAEQEIDPGRRAELIEETFAILQIEEPQKQVLKLGAKAAKA